MIEISCQCEIVVEQISTRKTINYASACGIIFFVCFCFKRNFGGRGKEKYKEKNEKSPHKEKNEKSPRISLFKDNHF